MGNLKQLVGHSNGNGNGRHSGIDPYTQLSKLLGLPAVGLHVTSARVVGSTRAASLDLYLSDGSSIYFENFKVFCSPTDLAIELVLATGAQPTLTGPVIIAAASLIRTIAAHEETLRTDDDTRCWGFEFLQAVSVVEVNMDDPADRWRGFSTLADIHPWNAARAQCTSVARASVALRAQDGSRYVRRGWFRDHVREHEALISGAEIATRMQRVGWQTPGTKGWVKASFPGRNQRLGWTFYVVPAGWEDQAAFGNEDSKGADSRDLQD